MIANRQSVECRDVGNRQYIKYAGDYSMRGVGETRSLTILLPGLKDPITIAIQRDLPAGRFWGWDGDEDRPTLDPSIQSQDGEIEWHGYLRKGRLESV
jgi:hypothetical protein